MTITACRALSQIIHEDLRILHDSTAFSACLEAVLASHSILIGITVASEQVIEFFDPDLLSIEEMTERNKWFAVDFENARYYLCRDGNARAVDRTEFFGVLWLRIIEREKKAGK